MDIRFPFVDIDIVFSAQDGNLPQPYVESGVEVFLPTNYDDLDFNSKFNIRCEMKSKIEDINNKFDCLYIQFMLTTDESECLMFLRKSESDNLRFMLSSENLYKDFAAVWRSYQLLIA